MTFDAGFEHGGNDTESLIRRVIEIVEGTRALPLSSSVKLDNKEEVLELLDEASQTLPEELRQARWLMRERDDYLARMAREGEEIVNAASARAERMVQRTEIVREANVTARRVVEEARNEARRLRMEAEDYCDQKLAAFEVVLDRTIKTVSAGREKLAYTPPRPDDNPGLYGESTQASGEDEDFFDQDFA